MRSIIRDPIWSGSYGTESKLEAGGRGMANRAQLSRSVVPSNCKKVRDDEQMYFFEFSDDCETVEIIPKRYL